MWGISAILFGKAVDSIGVSLTYGINMGISASLGSLIPLILFGQIPVASSFITLLLGMVVMLGGVGIITKAGLDKEKLMNQGEGQLVQQGQGQMRLDKTQVQRKLQVNSNGKTTNKGLSQGILMASLAGLGSAAMNIGFSYANQTLAIATSYGVNAVNASLIPWVITLSGGFVANFAYSVNQKSQLSGLCCSWGRESIWQGVGNVFDLVSCTGLLCKSFRHVRPTWCKCRLAYL